MADYERSSRRGKPQRELYRPGSGPLKKFGKVDEDHLVNDDNKSIKEANNKQMYKTSPRNMEIGKIKEELDKMSKSANPSISEPTQNSEVVRKVKKPDNAIYIPKQMAQCYAKEDRSEKNRSDGKSVGNKEDEKISSSIEGKKKNLNTTINQDKNAVDKPKKRSDGKKRKGKGRGGGKDEANHPEDRPPPLMQDLKPKPEVKYDGPCIDLRSRFLRHGSEPRSLPTTIQENRMRDTRSVEPNGPRVQDKSYNKPPSGHHGRRGSTNKFNIKQLPMRFDSLAPRLKRKYMVENGIQEPLEGSTGGPREAPWDGSSVTFQGNASRCHSQSVNSVYSKPPLPLMYQQVPPPPMWSQTLPNPGGRGRGRLRGEIDDPEQPERYSRSLTPEKVHDSHHYERFREESHEKQRSSHYDSQSNVNSKAKYDFTNHEEKENWRSENRHQSPVSRRHKNDSGWRNDEKLWRPPSVEPKTEVERVRTPNKKDKEEEKVISSQSVEVADVLDWAAEVERTEQLENLTVTHAKPHDTFVEPLPPSTKDRKKKKRRSLSRENNGKNNIRRGSAGNISTHSRNNSLERKWGGRDRDERRSRKSSGGDRSSRQSSVERYDNHCGNSKHRNNSNERRYRDNRYRHGSRERRDSGRQVEETNWRLEKQNMSRDGEVKQAGIIVLPQPVPKDDLGHNYSQPLESVRCQRQLYDPSNPGKPIPVPVHRNHENDKYCHQLYPPDLLKLTPISDQMSTTRPTWYQPYPESIRSHQNLQLLRLMEHADCELQCIVSSSAIIHCWERLQVLRSFLKDALKGLLLTELKFCQAENVEQHLWKMLYYNIIELLRKFMTEQPESKDKYKDILLGIIEEGTEYFEGILEDLEKTYKFKLDHILSAPVCLREGLGFIGLALIAAQKLFLFLGDLARYKEQANETNTYGVARQWYMKAHQINPKNGRPYNQLALLAIYTRRKLDAVYYYMRSLMASNPLITARDSLLSLFDENRKKYEGTEKKRKEERALREKEKMKEKEGGSGLRREIWVHPGGGKNVHRTTSASAPANYDSEDEELYSATNIEVNKRFCMSYLHVHGKFFTKIGLETLTETAVQMLKEFRALLQHSPIPLNSVRFLQLLALNMFAIEITQPKDLNQMEPGYRPALQESALVVSLQMFNLMVERFVQLLKEHMANPETPSPYIVPSDCLALLPAIKVWCDWLMTHVEVWNPPPSCQDYKVGPPGDCWSRLATLVSLLEKLDYRRNLLSTKEAEGYDLVYLPEDATLCGFTPLMANAQEPIYTSKDTDMELAQVSLRVHKVLFFGSVFLCGLDPPVLKVHKLETGLSEYVSVVDTPSSQEQSDADVCIETESSTDEESEDSGKATGLEEEEAEKILEPSGEVQSLILRKGELERVHRRQLKRNKHVQKILSQQAVVLEMEVRPHYLVPDTNCFIDYLPQLEAITKSSSSPHPLHPYSIMVPLIVINELDGLSKGCKPNQSVAHAALVREGARCAMSFLQIKHNALRCVTTRGTVLNSTTFTCEEDTDQEMKNDDKILATCLNLGQTYSKDEPTKEIKDGSPRKLFRNVVLLTEDRNLRVKALARDVPVRELPDFMRWAGLG